MSVTLARRLILGEAIPASVVLDALESSRVRGTPFLQGLLSARPELESALVRELASAQIEEISEVKIDQGLVEKLPPGLCQHLQALPIGRDPDTGRVRVAVSDPFHLHAAEEIAFHLDREVQLVLAGRQLITDAVETLLRAEDQERHQSQPAPVRSQPDGSQPDGSQPAKSQAAKSRAVRLQRSRSNLAPPARAGDAEGRSAPVSRHAPTRLEFKESDEPGPVPSAHLVRWPVAFDEASRLIRAAQRSDDVIDALLRGTAGTARHVALFLCRRGSFDLRARTRFGKPLRQFAAVSIPSGPPTVLRTAAREGQYVGPMPSTEHHRALLEMLGRDADEVGVVSVLVNDRPALLILVGGVAGSTEAVVQNAEKLSQVASGVLGRIVRTRRRGS